MGFFGMGEGKEKVERQSCTLGKKEGGGWITGRVVSSHRGVCWFEQTAVRPPTPSVTQVHLAQCAVVNTQLLMTATAWLSGSIWWCLWFC